MSYDLMVLSISQKNNVLDIFFGFDIYLTKCSGRGQRIFINLYLINQSNLIDGELF